MINPRFIAMVLGLLMIIGAIFGWKAALIVTGIYCIWAAIP
ncbi:MAG TPA: hypothetical protein VFM18_14470 [Methanosarcina sp.]|nr:hypothetical protein [Methanosarcina sp.]